MNKKKLKKLKRRTLELEILYSQLTEAVFDMGKSAEIRLEVLEQAVYCAPEPESKKNIDMVGLYPLDREWWEDMEASAYYVTTFGRVVDAYARTERTELANIGRLFRTTKEAEIFHSSCILKAELNRIAEKHNDGWLPDWGSFCGNMNRIGVDPLPEATALPITNFYFSSGTYFKDDNFPIRAMEISVEIFNLEKERIAFIKGGRVE